MSISLLLHPQRANRLVQQKALDKDQLGLTEVLAALLDATVKSKKEEGYLGGIQDVVNWQVLQELMYLASNEQSLPQVTETILFEMMRLKVVLGERSKATDPRYILMKKEVEGFIGNPKGYKKKVNAPKIPDGSPIGMQCMEPYHGN